MNEQRLLKLSRDGDLEARKELGRIRIRKLPLQFRGVDSKYAIRLCPPSYFSKCRVHGYQNSGGGISGNYGLCDGDGHGSELVMIDGEGWGDGAFVGYGGLDGNGDNMERISSYECSLSVIGSPLNA